MNVSLSAWLVILLGLFAANIPFFNERFLALISLRSASKSMWLRLVELFILYAVIGLIAWLLEERVGNVFSQGWEFYAVTGCLFLVFAFPGFVWRYLRK